MLFTYANADNGGRVINRSIEHFVLQDREKYCVVKNLGQLRYLSAMKYVDLLIGNTSSGIIEAASFQKPVVNIGNRQQGRLRGANVIDCEVNAIEESINHALTREFQVKFEDAVNIYGEGHASQCIAEQLELQKFDELKRFFDL